MPKLSAFALVIASAAARSLLFGYLPGIPERETDSPTSAPSISPLPTISSFPTITEAPTAPAPTAFCTDTNGGATNSYGWSCNFYSYYGTYYCSTSSCCHGF